MQTGRPVVRVFVSSTFRDMHAERDQLVTTVFPELRERLDRLGLDFFDIDLRWGVPSAAADGERANSWTYCKRWIDRVQPFFICILGQRYGFTPSSDSLGSEDRFVYDGLSITEMEVRHAVLRVPNDRQSFFYFRETAAPIEADGFVEDPERVAKLKELVETVAPGRVRKYHPTWTGTSFAGLEDFGQTVLEDLWSAILRDERYVAKTAWDGLADDGRAHIPPAVSEQIIQRLKLAPVTSSDAERSQRAAFVRERTTLFCGRSEELVFLTDFAINTSTRLSLKRFLRWIRRPAIRGPRPGKFCVVRSGPGQGKSALLCSLYRRLLDLKCLVIAEFVGATQRGTDIGQLESWLVGELDSHGVTKSKEPETGWRMATVVDHARDIAFRLANYAGDRRLVLIIDGIDQVVGGNPLRWLPVRLAPNVRVILSVMDRNVTGAVEQSTALESLNKRWPAPHWMELEGLCDQGIREITTQYFAEYCKELSLGELNAICEIHQTRNPLYLLLLLRELRTASGDQIRPGIRGVISEIVSSRRNAVELFHLMLERQEVFGLEIARSWWTYLFLGRVGMSGKELADLVARRFGESARPIALRIERGSRQYLSKQGSSWGFFHSQLRKAVMQRYCDDVMKPRHVEIASYFEDTWRNDDGRHALSELTHHQISGSLTDELVRTLTDFEYILSRLRAFDVGSLTEAFFLPESVTASLSSETTRALELIDEAISLSAYALRKSWTSLPGQLLGRLRESGPELTRLLRGARACQAFNWLAPIFPNLTPPGGPLRMTLRGHEGMVNAIRLLPDDRTVVTGGEDATVRIWDADRGNLLHTLQGHRMPVTEIEVTQSGMCVSASIEGTVRVWDPVSGSQLTLLKDASPPIAVTPDGRYALTGSVARERKADIYSSDPPPQLWDLKRGLILCDLTVHAEKIVSAVISTDGSRGATASAFGLVNVWNFRDRRIIRRCESDTVAPQLAMTTDGNKLLFQSDDSTMRLFMVNLDMFVASLRCRGHEVALAQFTPDGHRAVIAYQDGSIRLWHSDHGKVIHVLTGHTAPASALAISPDGRRLVSASHDHSIRVWNLDDGTAVRALIDHSDMVESLALSSDGRRAFSACWDGTVKVWDLDRLDQAPSFSGHGRRVENLIIDEHRGLAVSVAADGTAKVWDAIGPIPLRTYDVGHATTTIAVAMTVNAHIVTGSTDGAIRIWGMEGSDAIAALQDGSESLTACAISADQSTAIAGYEDGTIRVWDLNQRLVRHRINAHSEAVRSIAVVSSDRFVSGSSDHSAKLWSLPLSTCERAFLGHSHPITDALLDGNTLITHSSHDAATKTWDLESGRLLGMLSGRFWAVLRPPGAPVLIALSEYSGTTLTLWSVATSQLVSTLDALSDGISAFAVSTDGRRAAIGSQDGAVGIWNLDDGRLVASYFADGTVTKIAFKQRSIVVGDALGRLHFLDIQMNGQASTTTGGQQ